MAAYLVGHIRVRDPERWKHYVAGVPGTLGPFGGQVLFRGRRKAVLAGEHRHELVVVLRFPDPDAIASWHGSPAYQALVPIRDAAADVTLVSYEEVS